MYSHVRHQQTFFEMKVMRKEARPRGRMNSVPWRFLRTNGPPTSLLGVRWYSGWKKGARTHELLKSLAAFCLCARSQGFPATDMSMIPQNIATDIKEEHGAELVPRG